MNKKFIMGKVMALTQARLRELLHYDPETGIFTRLVGVNSNAKVGDVAGCRRADGYEKINVDGKQYFAHRLAWLYTDGYMPENLIDHVNRVKSDNSRRNLREVSNQCNIRNSKQRSSSFSGVRGVTFHKGANRLLAYIKVNYVRKHLGYYDSLIEAACARYAAEQCLNWNDCDSNSSAYQYLKNNGVTK